MNFNLLELSWYNHYKQINICMIDIGLVAWRGSLFYFEWHEGDIQWDLFYLNGDKPTTLG